MYFVPLYVAIRDRLISIVAFKFICKCQLKPTSETGVIYAANVISTPEM